MCRGIPKGHPLDSVNADYDRWEEMNELAEIERNILINNIYYEFDKFKRSKYNFLTDDYLERIEEKIEEYGNRDVTDIENIEFYDILEEFINEILEGVYEEWKI